MTLTVLLNPSRPASVSALLMGGLSEAILIAQNGDRRIPSSLGVTLTLQHGMPDVIARAVSAADRIAKRGSVVEIIVENGRDHYTVWNSAVDSFRAALLHALVPWHRGYDWSHARAIFLGTQPLSSKL